MSLYDSIANKLSGNGLTTIIGNSSDGALSGISDSINGAFGNSTFGKAISKTVSTQVRNAAVGLANKYIPGQYRQLVRSGTGAIGDIMNGDFSNAGLRVLDSGILDEFIPGMSGISSQVRFFNTPTPLMGGLTPAKAMEIMNDVMSTRYCHKNFFILEVSSELLGSTDRFNFLATDVEYSPFMITGEKRKIGAAHVDSVNSSDPIEIRLTTYDDEIGFIKHWFKAHCEARTASDGTVEPAGKSAITIKVIHGVVMGADTGNAYDDIGKFRPGNIDISLSRQDDSLQEIQLSFVQLDTFIPAI
jgi:hypothetical protein